MEQLQLLVDGRLQMLAYSFVALHRKKSFFYIDSFQLQRHHHGGGNKILEKL